MGRVIPFVRVSNHDDALPKGPFRAPLVTGGANPPVLVREAPAGPFRDTIERGANAGHLAIVPCPPWRRSFGPDLVALQGFVHVWTEGQAFKRFNKQFLRVDGTARAEARCRQQRRYAVHAPLPWMVRFEILHFTFVGLVNCFLAPKT